MPASFSDKAKIEKIEARLKRRDRTGWKYAAVMLGSGLAGFFCILPMILSTLFSGSIVFPVLSALFFVVMIVFLFWFSETTRLYSRDMDLMLESDTVLQLPLMAAYHDQFRTSPRTEEKEKARLLGEHAFQLLREQKETPQLPISPLRLLPVIRLLYYADSHADRKRLLDVIAASGTPECFQELDTIVKWICASPLREFEEERRRLQRMAHECKLAIRKAYPNVQASRSLLRGSASNDGLLRVTAPPRQKAETDNLLHASIKPEAPARQEERLI